MSLQRVFFKICHTCFSTRPHSGYNFPCYIFLIRWAFEILLLSVSSFSSSSSSAHHHHHCHFVILFQSNIESRALQIAPTVLHQTEAMMALLHRYNWTQFSIVTSLTAGYQDFATSLRTMAKNSQSQPQFSATGRQAKRWVEEVVVMAISLSTMAVCNKSNSGSGWW